MLSTILKYAKAVVGGLAAGVAALTPALADGAVTTGEWVTIAIAVLGGAGLIAAVPNKTTTPPASSAGSSVSSVPPVQTT